jgi:hypothetical protein
MKIFPPNKLQVVETAGGQPRDVLHTGNTPIQPNATNLILDSGANIGVGITNPTLALQIKKNGIARIELDSETSNSDVIFKEGGINIVGTIGSNNGSQDLAIRYGYHSGANGSLVFARQSTEAMRIDTRGNLLIGTTTPPTAGNPKAVRYGAGVQAGSLSSRVGLTAGVAATVLDMSQVVSGLSGTGLYLVSMCRTGGNVAGRWVGIVGLSASVAVIYSVIDSNQITATASGSNVQINATVSGTYDCNAIPLAITP